MKSLLLVLSLVTTGVLARLVYAEIPNFTPVASLALFAGYALRDRRWAMTVPFCIMALSDQILGGYQGALMLTVYASLALPVLWGAWARRRWAIRGTEPAQDVPRVLAVSSLGIVSSVVFFLTTNFMTWLVTDWYAKTWDGCLLCFSRGLEFFRYTLAGDLCFGLALFTLYAVTQAIVARLAPDSSAELAAPSA